MDIRDEILREHSKAQVLIIKAYINGDAKRYDKLVDIFLNDEVVVVQRASWVLSHCADDWPDLAVPYLQRFVEYAANPPHVAVKRNILRVMQFCKLPEEIEGPAYDLCWGLARSTKEDIAVRVFALTVLSRLAKRYHELIPEVRTLADAFVISESAGLKSRGRRIAKELSKAEKS